MLFSTHIEDAENGMGKSARGLRNDELANLRGEDVSRIIRSSDSIGMIDDTLGLEVDMHLTPAPTRTRLAANNTVQMYNTRKPPRCLSRRSPRKSWLAES